MAVKAQSSSSYGVKTPRWDPKGQFLDPAQWGVLQIPLSPLPEYPKWLSRCVDEIQVLRVSLVLCSALCSTTCMQKGSRIQVLRQRCHSRGSRHANTTDLSDIL